jgi:hypothetical protein
MYFHVILLRFAPAVPLQQADDAMRARIPEIRSYHYGRNDPDNPHHRGFTHAFVMGFAGRAERDAYQQHPAHLDFISTHLEPMLEDSLVFDFHDMDVHA